MPTSAFAAAGGNAVKLPDGEFVDLPVADRARRLLDLYTVARPDAPGPSPTPGDDPTPHELNCGGSTGQHLSVAEPREYRS